MIKITTNPKTDMDLLVCAELKQYQECESLITLIDNMKAWLSTQKSGTHIRFDHAYQIGLTKMSNHNYAECWHVKPDGTPDRKIAEMEVVR